MFDQGAQLSSHAALDGSEVLVIVHPDEIAASPAARLRTCRELIERWDGPLFALDDVYDHGAHGSEAEAFLEAVDAAVYDHVDRRRRGRIHADAERGLTRDAVRLVLRLAPSDAKFRVLTGDEFGWGRVVARELGAAGRAVIISSASTPPTWARDAREAA